MNAMPELRQAQPGDAAGIARLAAELGYTTSKAEVTSRLPLLLQSDNHYVIVADGTSTGLLGWTVAEQRVSLAASPKVEIIGLVVSASARRMNIGRQLVGAVERWAAEQGMTAICVRSNAVRADSHPFYQRLGYERAKTQHVYDKLL